MNLRYATLVSLLETTARLSPGAIACTFLEDTQKIALTWQELRQKSRAVAVAIRAIAAPGDRVVVVLPSGMDFLIALFGCLYAQVIVVPVSPPQKTDFLANLKPILAKTTPVLCLSSYDVFEHSSTQHAFNHLRQWPIFNKMASLWHDETFVLPGYEQITTLFMERIQVDQALEYQDAIIDPNTIALIQYTSGATGRPKGVVLSHNTIMANLEMNRLDTQINARDICVNWLSPFYTSGLIAGILQPMYCNAPVYSMPTAMFIAHPFRWLQTIMTSKATISSAPDFAWQLCIDTVSAEEKKHLDLSSWELAFCSGDSVRPESLEDFYHAFRSCGIRKNIFYAAYGLTESTVYSFGSKRNQGVVAIDVDSKALALQKIQPSQHNNTSSQQLPSYYGNDLQQVRIVDPDSLQECAPSEVGEIWLSGLSIAQGYWQEPLLTKAVFHNFINGQGPFLRTGDLGCLENNRLIVTGRCAEIISIDNKQYYPHLIERDIGRCHSNLIPDHVAAIGVSQSLIIMAEVETINADRAKAIFSTISRCIVANHGLYVHAILLIPRYTLKKTDNGKIKRLFMRRLYLDNTIDVLYRWEQKIAAIDFAVVPAENHLEPVVSEETPVNHTATVLDDNPVSFPMEFILKDEPSSEAISIKTQIPPPYVPDAIDRAIRGDSIKPISLTDVDDFIERQLFSVPLDSD